MISRREVLRQAGLLGLFGAGFGVNAFAKNQAKTKKRVLRFAHLTDVHMEPEMNAPAGFAKCLHHLQGQKDKPAFIVSGGDCIFDALKQPKDRVETQWKLWQDIVKQDNSLPIEYAIGNHDCWGFAQKEDPLYGKKFAMEKMHLQMPYRSFDKGGWHFIILDSIQPKTDDTWYTCKLDEAQFEWLKNDLAKTPSTTPVIVVSHVPIVSAAVVVVDNKLRGNDGYVLGLGSMHTDAPQIIEVFDQYPNIKLCLSGHIHLYEQIVYNGVTYISNGAVSGNWWKGIRYKTDNGYAMMNLYDDGSFDNEYVPYGWKV